jgi:protoheme IX farnesyltransferase
LESKSEPVAVGYPATPAIDAQGVQQGMRQASWRDYFQLTKPTISMLVVVTAVPAMLMPAMRGTGEIGASLPVALATLLGTWLASASASVFNHLLDHDVDMNMMRTRGRPLPSGRISNQKAFWFATFLGVTSWFVLNEYASPVSAWTAVAANAFYVLIYTAFLKRRTVQNIVIGGAAGAVGPLIGWAACTNDLGLVSAWPAWALFAVIFLWTPPHFWALAIKYKADYAAAHIPMMPVVRGDAVTRWQMLLYTVSLVPAVGSLYWFGAAGLVYMIPSMLLTLLFVRYAWRLWLTGENSLAMPLFHYSCFYLFGIFGSLTADRFLSLTGLS